MNRIEIPRRQPAPGNKQLVRISPEASEALDEVTRETAFPRSKVASMIILQAVHNGLIEYTEDQDPEEEEG